MRHNPGLAASPVSGMNWKWREAGIREARAKTDRLDARTLARLLWAGDLDAVWMPDEDCRVMRRRLARREQLVRSERLVAEQRSQGLLSGQS